MHMKVINSILILEIEVLDATGQVCVKLAIVDPMFFFFYATNVDPNSYTNHAVICMCKYYCQPKISLLDLFTVQSRFSDTFGLRKNCH